MAVSFKVFGQFLKLKDQSAGPGTPTGAVYFGSEAGVAKVYQPDGQIIPIVAGTTQIWTGGTSNTVYSNNTPNIVCGGSS